MNFLWQCPDESIAALVLAHGAGAGMRHRNMQALANAFERAGLATLRFDFPFMAAGRKRVDSPEVATACIADAFAEASRRASLPIWLAGHSFGGRMATHAVVDRGLGAAGLVLCSFPLHPAGRPSTERARHLAEVGLPMLFLSGTRDALAESALLESVVASLDEAELHWLATADHGYRVLKRSRQRSEDVFDEMGRVASEFVRRRPGPETLSGRAPARRRGSL